VERQQQISEGAELERDKPSARALRAPRPHLDAAELAAVFAGGFIGALARAGIVEELPVRAGQWPWATFAVNLAGAALLGFLLTVLQERMAPSLYRRSFLGSGVCGALTTFSTMMIELQRMLQGGHVALAGAYAATSIAGGLAVVLITTRAVRGVRLLA